MASILKKRPRPQLRNGAVWFLELDGFADLERVFLQRIPARSSDQKFMHQHAGAQLLLIVHGSATVAIRHPAQEWRLNCGDALMVPGEVLHNWVHIGADGVDVMAINFVEVPSQGLLPLLSTLELMGRIDAVFAKDPNLIEIFRSLHQGIQTSSLSRIPEAAARSLFLVSAVGRLVERAGLLKPTPAFAPIPGRYVTRARIFMGRHLSETLSLEDLAEHAGISASHLVRLFREKLNRSPMQELTFLRIESAKRYLMTTDWSTSRIAAKVGLTNMSYLSRIFTKTVGESPRVYRNRKKISGIENG